jgi:hypothetical protein
MSGTGDEPQTDRDLQAVERRQRERHAELQERLARLARPPERATGISFGKRNGDGTTEAVSRLVREDLVAPGLTVELSLSLLPLHRVASRGANERA